MGGALVNKRSFRDYLTARGIRSDAEIEALL